MIVKNAKFEITAVRPEQYPKSEVPEIAMVGRSNVGKSSFINTMLNRKNLARVGAKPGKTREINFYNVDELLYLVDLPGYGYAAVSKEKKSTWNEVIETYLTSRPQLKLIIMLVDIRHLPSEDDKLMHQWLAASEIDYIILAAKADKIPKAQVQKSLNNIRNSLGLADDKKIILFSAETRQGKEDTWKMIDEKINL